MMEYVSSKWRQNSNSHNVDRHLLMLSHSRLVWAHADIQTNIQTYTCIAPPPRPWGLFLHAWELMKTTLEIEDIFKKILAPQLYQSLIILLSFLLSLNIEPTTHTEL